MAKYIKDFTKNYEEEFAHNIAIAEAGKVTKEIPLKDISVESVRPESINIGDTLFYYGFTGLVDDIETYEHGGQTVYVFKLEYESGSLFYFNWFHESINNGCNRGHRAHAQGNNKCKFQRVAA